MEHRTQLPGYYTATEAAEALGYRDYSYIARQCAAGKILAYKVGMYWLIPASWVEQQGKEAPKGQGNRGVERK